MKHDTHETPVGLFHCFTTERGKVAVRLQIEGDEARVHVYEKEAALAAIGRSNKEARETEEAAAARNHFGTGLMLRILKTVVRAHPEVKRWITDNRDKSLVNEGRLHERTFNGSPS